MKLESEVALVTGASRGIGKAIAIELGQAGATVIGTSTTEVGAEGISTYLSKCKIKGRGMALDVTKPETIDTLFQVITSDFAAVSILVNNAGITHDNILIRMKDEEWDSVIQTDLSSVYRLSKACLRGMMKARKGRIINIASVIGSIGNAGQSNYAAAKAGVIGFSKSLAREIGSRNITVNIVAPGFIDTDMTKVLGEEQRQILLTQIPLQRLGEPEDIARVVAFLASEAGSYITGETIHVNGGMYMS